MNPVYKIWKVKLHEYNGEEWSSRCVGYALTKNEEEEVALMDSYEPDCDSYQTYIRKAAFQPEDLGKMVNALIGYQLPIKFDPSDGTYWCPICKEWSPSPIMKWVNNDDVELVKCPVCDYVGEVEVEG